MLPEVRSCQRTYSYLCTYSYIYIQHHSGMREGHRHVSIDPNSAPRIDTRMISDQWPLDTELVYLVYVLL